MSKLSWSVHHVNLNVYSMQDSVRFYSELIGLEGGRTRDQIYENKTKSQTEAYFFGEGLRGLHLNKPDVTLAQRYNMAINPTIGGHVAISVPDVLAVRRRLEAAGIVCSDMGKWALPGVHQIYVCDPAMNIIEINQSE